MKVEKSTKEVQYLGNAVVAKYTLHLSFEALQYRFLAVVLANAESIAQEACHCVVSRAAFLGAAEVDSPTKPGVFSAQTSNQLGDKSGLPGPLIANDAYQLWRLKIHRRSDRGVHFSELRLPTHQFDGLPMHGKLLGWGRARAQRRSRASTAN